MKSILAGYPAIPWAYPRIFSYEEFLPGNLVVLSVLYELGSEECPRVVTTVFRPEDPERTAYEC
jgi:hypothetical protein